MNILLVHNYYQLPGGEDTVVANEKKLLEDHGYKVILYTRHNDELKKFTLGQKILFPFRSVFNGQVYREIKQILRKEHIDVLHVHNTLSIISPSVYYAGVKCGVPVVQTVHNFRLICPEAMLYRDGHICEDCLSKGMSCAVKHGCYRNSKLQTLALALNMWVHRCTGIYKKISYICLTEFNKQKLLCHPQIRPEQIFVKPNFVEYSAEPLPAEKRENQFVFAGRLDELKGIDVLLKAWKILGENAPKLLVCGTDSDGYAHRYSQANVIFMGQVPYGELLKLVGQSKAVIIPTKLYEGFGLGVVEAYSVGTSVICSDIGNVSDMVIEGLTGFKFEANNAEALVKAIQPFEKANFEKLSQNAWQEYNNKYAPAKNYEMLEEIYQVVI